MKIKWLATDGVPGDGYRAQIASFQLGDGAVLEMDSTAILEHTAPDPTGGIGAYLVTFTGMVGFASDHPDRPRVDQLDTEEIGYIMTFVRDDDGHVAVEGKDYQVRESPRATAHKLPRR